jgi:hypothetical protein
MELKSMKMSPAEQKEYAQPSLVTGPDAPSYPWGLCLTVDDDALEKLGLPALPTVGQTMMLMASVEVKSVSASQRGDELYRSLELQITDMALEPSAAAKKQDTAEVLYGGDQHHGSSDQIVLEG